ncbi:hypothetical protein Sjap_011328 [Stephania japonica]|uniref:Uncharacterized protein n=1 Tax=Stephania japonica TaxID=461633 RepID=A0AAP0P802_9MAGN
MLYSLFRVFVAGGTVPGHGRLEATPLAGGGSFSWGKDPKRVAALLGPASEGDDNPSVAVAGPSAPPKRDKGREG